MWNFTQKSYKIKVPLCICLGHTSLFGYSHNPLHPHPPPSSFWLWSLSFTFTLLLQAFGYEELASPLPISLPSYFATSSKLPLKLHFLSSTHHVWLKVISFFLLPPSLLCFNFMLMLPLSITKWKSMKREKAYFANFFKI